MKRVVSILIVCVLSLPLLAQSELKSETDTTLQQLQVRVGATFTKSLPHNFELSIGEEIRIIGYEHNHTAERAGQPASYFQRAYTTVGIGYEPIEYLKADAEYTLKLYGQHGWSDPNEYLRHRASVSLTGQYAYLDWKFSLRERFVADFRTDSINPLEKPRCDMQLRHRVQVSYSPRFRPYRPYVNVELINTLNQPTYEPPYTNERGESYRGGQYVSSVRTAIGCKYRASKRSSLNFYYRFDAGWANDYNITHAKQHLEVVHETTYTHIVGLIYEFDW